VADALLSVQQQTCSDWECIIINDGSTDGGRDVALSFTQKDGRMRLIDQSNRGLAAARNRGLDEAQGRFIQFLDADDAIEPEKFQLQLELLSKIPKPGLSYTDYYAAPEDDLQQHYPFYLSPRFISPNPLHDLILRWEARMSIPIHCFLFDAVFFREHAIRFSELLPNHEDWECWMNIFKRGPIVRYLTRPLAVYRIHPHSMARDKRRMTDGFLQALALQRGQFAPGSVEFRLLGRKMLLVRFGYYGHRILRAFRRRVG